MMDEKLRNITEINMFENLQNNMFSAAGPKSEKQGQQRAQLAGERQAPPSLKTKLKLMENIKKATAESMTRVSALTTQD